MAFRAYSAYPALWPYACMLCSNPPYITLVIRPTEKRIKGKIPMMINAKSHPLMKANAKPAKLIEKDITIVPIFSPVAF